MADEFKSELRFTKIKFNGSKVTLIYEKTREAGEPDEFSLTCGDMPAPEFIAALRDLAIDVIGICELAEEQVHKVSVRGVTLTYTNGILGAVITACKSLQTSAAPMLINTPHLPSESYGDTPSEQVLDEDTIKRIETLVEQATKYMNGERAQGSLLPAA